MKRIKNIILSLMIMIIGSVSVTVFADGEAVPDSYARVVLVGNYKCGKSSIWNRMFSAPFDEHEGASDRMNRRDAIRELSDGKNVQFNIWDTAGAKEYYSQVVAFSEGANFVIIVHDLSEKYTEATERYLDQLCADVKNKMCADGKIILVGTKWDLREGSQEYTNFSKQRTLLEGMAKTLECVCVVTSSKDEAMSHKGITRIMSYLKNESETMKLYTTNPDSKFSVAFKIKPWWPPCILM